MQNIPALRLSYANLLLKALDRRGESTIEELLDIEDVESLFKSDRQHQNPAGRAGDMLRYAQLLNLVERSGNRFALTDQGRVYVAGIRPEVPWQTTPDQSRVLREFISRDEAGLSKDALLALKVQCQVNLSGRECSTEEFGRLLARAGNVEQWREPKTFEAQGARFRALLQEAGLITATSDLTSEANELLEASVVSAVDIVRGFRPTVWWVNQGGTYGKERKGGFIWAPMLNKAGRTVGHWDSMDDVRPSDVILHYSNGFLRAFSVAEGTAQPKPNPLDTDEWEKDGRLIRTRYRDLNDPIALASIPEELRSTHGGPFTAQGSVVQGYLFQLASNLVDSLADLFPELRDVLNGSASNTIPDPPSEPTTPDVVHASFAGAVESSGLSFEPGGNLVRSFVCSMLTKPFAILTGLSGSGKTQLAMKLGEWFGRDEQGRPCYLVVPVRPDWTGPEALFGYEDVLRSSATHGSVWAVPESLELILRASADPTRPYLLILDEMNLAHVERYFADFLSGVESRKPLLPDLELDAVGHSWVLRSGSTTKLPLPRNLFAVGTVNVDESTYMFSPKVLDRASTFEFRVNAQMLDADQARPTPAMPGSAVVQRAFCDLAENDEWHRQNPHPEQGTIAENLRKFHTILSEADLEFGHRTFYESLRFAAFYAATGDNDISSVLDLVVMQKLLPKVHGSRRRVEPMLANLLLEASSKGEGVPALPLAHAKISRMIESVRANQYVSFTD